MHIPKIRTDYQSLFCFPLSGIEIVNPNAAEKKAEEDGCTTYFSNQSSFVKLKPRSVMS